MSSPSNEVIASERRAHHRVALRARAELTAGGSPRVMQARDLSLGGLGLAGELALAPGTLVDLELQLAGERVRTPGEVVARAGTVGVRFTRLDQYALTRIQRVVALAPA